jgi:hypothetical protein
LRGRTILPFRTGGGVVGVEAAAASEGASLLDTKRRVDVVVVVVVDGDVDVTLDVSVLGEAVIVKALLVLQATLVTNHRDKENLMICTPMYLFM